MTLERRSETKLVKPENTLKKKAGSGGFDERTLVKAQGMIETNTIDFVPLAAELADGLEAMLTELRATPGSITKDQIDQVMYPLMQLKSQGSLFHYGVITKMSHIVLDFIENVPAFDADVLDILGAYKKSISAVLRLKIKDENNKIAKDLCRELNDACARYRNSRLK